MSNQKVNGSVLKLAQAFRNVITEAIQPIEKRMDERMDGFENNINILKESFSEQRKNIDETINNTNENMQSQFSAQEEKMAYNFKGIDNQFGEMGKRFDNIDKHLAGLPKQKKKQRAR